MGFVLAIGYVALAAAQNSKADLADARELFNKTCASCHSKDGKAETPAARLLGVKDLSQSKLSKDQIILQIREGKLAPDAKSKMPAFKDRLSAEQIESLVPLVLGFRGSTPDGEK